MSESNQIVVFTIDDQTYGLDLSCVERIVRAVEVTHLPDAPDVLHGVINVEGRVIPLVNSRRRLGLPEREIDLNDLFIILKAGGRSVALVADDVKPVMDVPHNELVRAGEFLPEAGYVQAVAKGEEGMIMILPVESTLSFEEHDRLSPAIEGLGAK